MTSLTEPANRARPWLLSMRRWIILAMLLSLHAALIADPGTAYQRVWLLVHFGLFLLWQPFVATDEELRVFAVLLIFFITSTMLYFVSGWMFATWIAILIGILGGKVFTQQANVRSRFYLVAAFYLFAALLVWALPVLLLGIDNLPEGTRVLVTVFLPLTLVLLVFLPFSAEDDGGRQVFDFFYSMFIFQLVVTLSLGSVALMRVTNNDYYAALVLAVLGSAAALFVLAVLWGPRTGFGGLRTYFSRYLMSVGMPFELWMRRIAEMADTGLSPASFLSSAMRETAKMPWVQGGTWRSPDGHGEFGKQSGRPAKFQFHDLEIVFFTEIELSPALFLHVRLLAQVVGEFYEGKRREEALRQSAYMRAVHETGAQLTHDMKNLLQSLYALTSASMSKRAAAPEGGAAAYQALVESQLPHLTKRLQLTLDKLQNPEKARHSVALSAGVWWEDIAARFQGRGVEVTRTLHPEVMLTASLFDAVLDNCVENALGKQRADANIRIKVALFESDAAPALSIIDNGDAIPAEIARCLFEGPMTPGQGSGMGIGLFQAARLAKQAGFELTLAANEPGNVKFLLSRPPSAAAARAIDLAQYFVDRS